VPKNTPLFCKVFLRFASDRVDDSDASCIFSFMPDRRRNPERTTPHNDKICKTCGRSFEWRKKWERDWDVIKYCSICRRAYPAPRASGERAHKTGSHKTGSKTAKGQAWTDQHSKNNSKNKSSTGHGRAKKQPAKQASRCWPGYDRFLGRAEGGKEVAGRRLVRRRQKKSDAMAAAANKLRKG
jgi:hypothetical protein